MTTQLRCGCLLKFGSGEHVANDLCPVAAALYANALEESITRCASSVVAMLLDSLCDHLSLPPVSALKQECASPDARAALEIQWWLARDGLLRLLQRRFPRLAGYFAVAGTPPTVPGSDHESAFIIAAFTLPLRDVQFRAAYHMAVKYCPPSPDWVDHIAHRLAAECASTMLAWGLGTPQRDETKGV